MKVEEEVKFREIDIEGHRVLEVITIVRLVYADGTIQEDVNKRHSPWPGTDKKE